MAKEMTQVWDELWDDVQKCRHALEYELRKGISEERRLQLETAYQAAHKRWWKSVNNFGK